ncbi:MAG: phosphotransferase, partial [Candidatus Competibacterales bacterium]|nr:phosphotransferase [Candidatus Competibacterales bacterium]
MPTTDEQLTPVRAGHDFDRDRLADCLAAGLPGFAGPLQVRQFEGGQSNPTFLLETPERRYVLRKKPPGELLPSAHLIEREYRVMAALADSAVPVPRVHLLCEDAAVIGTSFFVMDYVPGRLLRDPALPGLAPEQRRAVHRAMVQTLADLHGLDVDAVGLGDYGRRGGYVDRQIRRWSEQYRATETDPLAAMDRLIEWLPRHVRGEDGCCLVHGDYRIDNLLFHPERAETVAVLDWELSTLGHPLADLAYTCMYFHLRLPDGYLGDVAGRDGLPTE